MNKFKILMVIVIAIFSLNTVSAQTKTKSTTKTTKKTIVASKYQCPMKCEGDKTYAKAGKCPVCNMELVKLPKELKTAAAYACPMKCEGEKTYAKEGKCPVCNMNLTKVDTKAAEKSMETHNHNL